MREPFDRYLSNAYYGAHMSDDFLSAFLANKIRARLLRVFILSPENMYTVRQAAHRAGVSVSAADTELKALERIGVLKQGKVTVSVKSAGGRKVEGRQKEYTWSFNLRFPYARALSLFVHEISPMEHRDIIDTLKPSGKLASIILSGSFVGDISRPIDLIVAGEPLNEGRLERAVRALESQFGRELRYAAFSTSEFRYRLTIEDRLIRETIDFPHVVLLDNARLFKNNFRRNMA